MKLLPLAAVALATLFAAKAAVAQTPVYDTVTNATVANYAALGCTLPPPQIGSTFLAGDNLTSAVNICQADIYFVAVAAGTYNISVDFWGNACFSPTPTPPALGIIASTGTFPVTIPSAGVWVVTVTGTVGGVTGVSVTTDGDNFVPCFDNSAAIPAIDTNGAAFDLNCNGALEICAGGTEFRTFDAAWTNMNMLMVLYDGCPPAPGLRGPSAMRQASVRKVDNLPVKKHKGLLRASDFAVKFF